jgi:hypothetical protein
MNKPTIVCLCGSTKFKEEFERAERMHSLQGRIVLTVGLFGHVEGLDMTGETKTMLDELHKRKIDMCDYIFVINVDGYIGESTRNEILYAQEKGKPVKFAFQRGYQGGDMNQPKRRTVTVRLNGILLFNMLLADNELLAVDVEDAGIIRREARTVGELATLLRDYHTMLERRAK